VAGGSRRGTAPVAALRLSIGTVAFAIMIAWAFKDAVGAMLSAEIMLALNSSPMASAMEDTKLCEMLLHVFSS
jgi:hypothetical protein